MASNVTPGLGNQQAFTGSTSGLAVLPARHGGPLGRAHPAKRVSSTNQQRMEEILTTALELFSRYGFHGTSMRDIGDAVGLDKSSLYNYLGSKDELLSKLLGDHTERHFTGAFAALDSLDDPRAAMERLVDHLVTMGITEWRYTMLYRREQASLPQDLYMQMQQRSAQLLERIKVAIQSGIKAGVFRQGLDVESTALAISGLGYDIHSWAPGMQNLDVDRIRNAYREFALRGLLLA